MRMIFLVLALLLGSLSAEARPPRPEDGVAQQLPVQKLAIESGRRVHHFNVMMARSDAEQTVGLMWRRALTGSEGMLFPLREERMAAFWMRNTLIPLDIIFIRKDGRIANIIANAEPLSEEPLPSAGKVAAVLEIAGGRAAALGIRAGDRVNW
jgi:uncharacterized protein